MYYCLVDFIVNDLSLSFEGKSATFIKHYKIRTKSYIFQVAGRYYNFICNKPKKEKYMLYTGIDDNSRFFADRCSYGLAKIEKKKVQAILKKAGKTLGGRYIT